MSTRFDLGLVVMTRTAADTFSRREMLTCLARHSRCDWGDLCASDKKSNDLAVEFGDRILSSYILDNGRKMWIITEADRSSTTILLPSDY